MSTGCYLSDLDTATDTSHGAEAGRFQARARRRQSFASFQIVKDEEKGKSYKGIDNFVAWGGPALANLGSKRL